MGIFFLTDQIAVFIGSMIFYIFFTFQRINVFKYHLAIFTIRFAENAIII